MWQIDFNKPTDWLVGAIKKYEGSVVEVMRGPVRTCIGCRKSDSISELFRVVLEEYPDSNSTTFTDSRAVPRVVVDLFRVRNGRGVWLHSSMKCLELAEKKRSFSRGLRTQGEIDTTNVSTFADSGFCQVGKI